MHRSVPGFLNTLQLQLESLNFDQLKRVTRSGGLDPHDLINLITHPKDQTIDLPEEVLLGDVIGYEDIAERFSALGSKLFEDAKIAFCILAGDAGTRMGGPKALIQIPGTDDTLLSLKLKQSKHVPDVWILTSPDLTQKIKVYIESNGLSRHGLQVIEQYESIRLDSLNCLVYDSSGNPCFHPAGHGDVIPALLHCGVLSKFLARGGKHVAVVNVDNVVAEPDARLYGLHDSADHYVTCEVVKRLSSDSGGFLCSYQGVNQIVERFRMSSETDVNQFRWLNTNSMIFKADLPFENVKWTWHRVKKVVDDKVIIQYERLLQQLTEFFKASFVAVPRDKRFKPIKNADDLQKI